MSKEIDSMQIENLSKKLDLLVSSIEKNIEDGISRSIYHSEDELYFKWKLKDFQYTDKGIVNSSANGEYLIKKTWVRVRNEIKESIVNSLEFKSIDSELVTIFPEERLTKEKLDILIGKIIDDYFQSRENGTKKESSFAKKFIEEMLGQPVRYGAEIQLQGVTLKSNKINIAAGIAIRQPIKDDLEKEIPYYGPTAFQGYNIPNPSAILNVEFIGPGAREIQEKVNMAVVILKLFKVGSVKYSSYRMYSDSVTDMMASGTMFGGDSSHAIEIYNIKEDDEQKLKKFWDVIEKHIPQSLYRIGSREISPTILAFDRYSDALKHDGILERRITNVVMGLEALLLDETQELSYRLGLRVAKLMAQSGKDPIKTRRIIKDAYTIRSLFSHGGHLSYKEQKRLEHVYADVKNIFIYCIEYLQQLIIITMLLHKSKDEFIDLVDDSFIDKKREESLISLLSFPMQVIK
jgi:hypothetical protein